LKNQLEIEVKPTCICVNCGWLIDKATRDNPCPNCGSTQFKVKYEKSQLKLPKP